MLDKLSKNFLSPYDAAFYDMKAKSQQELLANFHAKLNECVDEINGFIDSYKNSLAEFKAEDEKSKQEHMTALRQEFQDFINIIELKVKGQENTIDSSIKYISENLQDSVARIIDDMKESGELSDAILSSLDNVKIELQEIINTLELNVNEEFESITLDIGKVKSDVAGLHGSVSGLQEDVEPMKIVVEKIQSHVGMIIHSTTLDSMEKVIDIYGGTTWVKIEGQFLLGQSSSYAINSTGGSTTNTLSVANLPSHSHGLNNHTHSIPSLSGSTITKGSHQHLGYFQTYGVNAGGMGTLIDGGSAAGTTNTAVTVVGGDHEHTISTNASTTGKASGNTANTGSGTPINNMPPYKTVYIWERTE